MGGPQGLAPRRRPRVSRRAVLTRTPRRPNSRPKCVFRVFILVGNVQICDSAAAARVVTNEIASRRGRGDTPAPEVGRAALLILSRNCHPQPGVNPILNGAKYVLLGSAGPLRYFKRVIAPFDDEQLAEGIQLTKDRL